MEREISLSRPDITQQEIDAVIEVLRSGRLSIGPRQDRFEELVAERTRSTHAVACSSGTAGLHMALLALNVGPGDEVITTPFSFVASANCILYVGAKPVFVDIDPVSLNLDPAKLEAAITPKTKAIIAVEAFGNPAGMDKIAQIAGKHEIPLVEDSCEGLGSTYKARPVGSFGRVGVFGFYPNKQITTGEGGMIVTNDDRLADMCRSLRNQGRAAGSMPGQNNDAGSWLSHERLGYNYRLSEIAAAIGCVQMERFDAILKKRQDVACMYFDRLMDNSDVILPNIEPDTTMSWFVFVIRLSDQFSAVARHRIMSGLKKHDVGCSNYFPPIHLQPYFRQFFDYKTGDFPITESVSQRTIALPFHNFMDATQVELASLTLKVMIDREKLMLDAAKKKSPPPEGETPGDNPLARRG
ncbi:MAG: DegT/DnrJ/EryC1/StrS family aminotransferase [Phycisphaerales bacterium]